MFCPVAEAQKYGFQSVGVVRYLFWLGKPAIVREKLTPYTKMVDPAQANDVSLHSFQVGIQLESGLFKSNCSKVTIRIIC
jgi:hypothetical protein